MSVEQHVDALTASVEDLKGAVVSKKATLDASVADAQSATAQTQDAKVNALSARDQAEAFKNATYTLAQSAASALAYQDLSAVAQDKAVTAVDVFIYDTAKDSDGGAWRHRCAGTSWLKEPLNTETRGGRWDFPAVAVLVLEALKLTIYDGDDPSLPMWRVWDFIGLEIRTADARDGKIVVATSTGLMVLDLLTDRNSVGLANTAATTPAIVNASCNDVAMTILPNAPVDPSTRLPVPTIAVATDGGASVIRHDGTVVDLSGNAPGCSAIAFDDNGLLIGDAFASRVFAGSIPKVDTTLTNWRDAQFARTGLGGTDAFVTPQATDRFDKITARAFAASNGARLIQLLKHPASPEKSAIAFAASNFATGWMPGDIKGAFLSDTDDTALFGDGMLTAPDRSVANTPLLVNGIISREPVATGAELVGYAGFSDTNYLEQEHNPELDFGTGDFCVLGWVYSTDATYRGLVGIEHLYPDANGDTGWVLFTSGSADVRFRRLMNGAIADVGVPYAWPPGWSFFCVARIGTTMRLWTNGSYIGENSHSTLAFDVSGSPERTLKIGRTSNYGGKRAALLRISATVPNTDQIHRIYQDEKALFQESAACTLYGASDAVTALAHDPDTGLLHVGTSAGRSVFKGLRRVAHTTVPVRAAIAAAGGMVIEE